MVDSPGGGSAIEMWLAEAEGLPSAQPVLQEAVWAELRRAVALEGAELMVEVRERTATLTGTVRSCALKTAARAAAARVPGIERVDDRIVVRPQPADARSDAALLTMVRSVLDWDSRIANGVDATVRDGRVVLTGTVDQEDEREAAADTVTALIGVREVINRIAVRALPPGPEATARLEQTIGRALGHDARRVRVVLQPSGVELRGRVRSLALRLDAEGAVRRVLGGVPLANRLVIDP